MVVANQTDDTLTFSRGIGDGTLDNPVAYSVGHAPFGIVLADLDHDGRLDGVVLNSRSSTHASGVVRVLISNGRDGFTLGATLQADDTPLAIAARDVTGDRVPDILVANRGANSVSVFANLGGGAFASPVSLIVTPEPTAVAAGDFDGDGSYDIGAGGAHPAVATNLVTTTVRRGDGNADGALSAADLVASMTAAVRAELRVEQASRDALDANGDGVVNQQDALATMRRIFGRVRQLS